METDANPYRRLSADISPIAFELFCLETLKAYAKNEGLKDFRILHNQKVSVNDGLYQIDILCHFTALGTSIKTIVECKKYSRPIEREKVTVLFSKIGSIGANQGIFISTSGFQKGATTYAKEHGISLIQIFDENVFHIVASANPLHDERLYMENEMRKRLPKFRSLLWDNEKDFPLEQIYPTREMIRNACDEVIKLKGL